MINIRPIQARLLHDILMQVRFVTQLGDLGCGAGRGGGAGGSIREAGGAFGKAEAATEEEYFFKKQKKQLIQLKEDLHNEINFHKEQIKRHQEVINSHKRRAVA